MAKVFAVSMLAASLSIFLVSPAHAFGVKTAFDKVDTADLLGLSSNLPFVAATQEARSSANSVSSVSAAVAEQVSAPVSFAAVSTFNEGFSSVNTLSASGWAFQNNSDPGPAGTTPTANWGQGVSGNPVNAQAGANNSYIFVNTDSSTGDFDGVNGQVSNWLITPELDFSQGGIFSFYTRTFVDNPANEKVDIRLSTNGTSTNVGTTPTSVGDFGVLLGSVGSLTALDYPGATAANNAYQQFSFTIAPTTGTGRIAFNYVGNNGGGNGTTSQFAAFDTVAFTPVPEPATAFGTPMLVGLAIAGLRNKFKKAKA